MSSQVQVTTRTRDRKHGAGGKQRDIWMKEKAPPTQPNRVGSTIHDLQPMGEMYSITRSGKIIHVCLHCIQKFQLLA